MVTIKQLARPEDRIIIAYTLSSIDFMAMLVPVMVLLWQNSSLSIGEMLLLQGIFQLFILFAEIPTGALSDSWFGRKRIEILGNGLLATSLLSYALATDFSGFAIGEALGGIALAMKSGNISSMLYDSLSEQKSVHRFGRIVGKVATMRFLVASIANIVGGFLGSISLQFPLFLLVLIYSWITFYDFLALEEPGRIRADTARQATMQAMKTIIRSPILIILMIYTISTGVFSSIVFWGYQPLMIELGGFDSIMIGFAMAGFNIVAAVGSRLFLKYESRIKVRIWLFGMVSIALFATIGIFIASEVMVLLLSISFLQIVRGISAPFSSTIQQEYLRSSERNSFVSIDSFKNSVLYIGFSVFLIEQSLGQILSVLIAGYLLITVLIGMSIMIHYLKAPKLKVLSLDNAKSHN